MLSERPRSSQEHLGASSGGGGDEKEASLRRTTSLRSGELPRRLSLGTREVDAGETGDAPVTPSYMQATKSVKAKARCASPTSADRADRSSSLINEKWFTLNTMHFQYISSSPSYRC